MHETSQATLQGFLDRSARIYPDRTAVEDCANDRISYKDLALLSDHIRSKLHRMEVRSGDRVAVYMPKSIGAVAAIFGIMKAGAAYVPIDHTAPIARSVCIMNDCAVKAIVSEEHLINSLSAGFSQSAAIPPCLTFDESGQSLTSSFSNETEPRQDHSFENEASSPDDLAYLLYTSGSTGKPKGVMLSHRNAISFIDWCSTTFEPTEFDRFSSHAPFFFDLSILDLYLSVKHGSTLVLFDQEVGKSPLQLAPLISEKKITIWYSAPSTLSMLVQYGRMERYDYSSLRLVLFAGEVFPIKHLRTLKNLVPQPRYYNLYGPTETNVCLFYEIPGDIPKKRTQPFPIGKTCDHLQSRIVDALGNRVREGQQGELCIKGPAVMQGYWKTSRQAENISLENDSDESWYRTGDVVVEKADGSHIFLGRLDRMVKRRGYRIELGEIEACLYNHSAVEEAAVIAKPDKETGVLISVFLNCPGEKRPSVIELKRFCTENLPTYMAPDAFLFHDILPRTSTGKIDYQTLQEIV